MTSVRLAVIATGIAVTLGFFFVSGLPHAARADEVSTYGGRCNNKEGAGREFSQDYYVYFDTNSSRIRERDLKKIEYVYGIATGHQAQQICLFGKASKNGDEAANVRLSRKRSLNVAHAFENLGWSTARIRIIPEGEAWGWLEDTLTSDSEDDRRVRIRLSQ